METFIKIDNELNNQIQRLANAKQRSIHWVTREAINHYVAGEEFKQGALASWATYQETGQHLTGSEIHAWLDTWGSAQGMELPMCHD